MHTPSSFGGTFNLGGQTIATASSAFHIYTLDWTAEKMVFAVDGVTHYTYNPSIKNASTWPFDSEQYLLLNFAIQSNISSSFTEGAMEVDYVRVYKNNTVDTQAPINFTAIAGAITGSSVELLLNATDNSGNVTYNVTYGSGTTTTIGTSGVQKSLIIPNLSPNTNYTFTVTATDASENTALNNPILVTATTTANVSSACAGTASEASQGSFTTGYKYAFETIGTDVKFTFELLDVNKIAVVAYLWKQTPFGETAMENVSGKIFTKTINGQTIGSTINYAVKFAYAGGMSVTKYFPYVVGSSCENTTPNATAQTFCGIATVSSLLATGTSLKWYDVSVGGTSLSSSTVLSTKIYYVSQTLAGIESSRAAVSVTITPNTAIGSDLVSACGSSYTWGLNGQTYNSSGVYTYITGCNTATLSLTLTNVTTNGSVTQSQVGGSYTWPANGQTYTASTTETVVSGCNTATLNLTITSSSNNTEPTTSAPIPTKLATDVKSVFSDTYTNISTIELFPDWGQGTKFLNYVIPASSPVNNVIKYSNLDYQGINVTAAGNPPGVDFSTMTTLHIDVWTPDVTSFKLFPIDNNTDLLFKTLTPTKSGWNSYDIVLATDFPSLNKASIRQFKFEKTAFVYKGEINTIYFDNIYFWRDSVVAPIASAQTFCGIATVASLVAAGTALKWYEVSVGGNSLSSTTNLTTKTYYVSQTLAGTESPRTAVSVTITPATTVGSISISTCESYYTWGVNGQTYTSSGVYTHLVGCNTATLSLTLTTVTTNGSVTQSQVGGSYTWPVNGQTYTVSTIQTVVSGCNTATLNLTITPINNQIPVGPLSFCKGATVASAVGSSSLKFYTTLLGGTSLDGNAALITKILYVTQTINSVESTPRVPILIKINALPPTPTGLTSVDSKMICKYIGTTNPVTFTATATDATSYNWTVPAGVSILSGAGTSTITVSLFGASTNTTIGGVGLVTVNSVDSNGCISDPKSLSLTSKIPTSPNSLILTSTDTALGFNVSGVPTSLSSLQKIIKVGPYTGTAKVFTLTAPIVTTADHYRWSLPIGVNQLSGGTSNIITINFAGVTTAIESLPISVYSVGGCGESIAKTLKLTRSLPSAPTALVLTDTAVSSTSAVFKVSEYTARTTVLKLTATPFLNQGGESTSFKWILPSGINVIEGASLSANNGVTKTWTGSVNVLSINFAGIGTGVTTIPMSVYGVNGSGTSAVRTLTVTATAPATPGLITTPSLALPTYNSSCSSTITLQVPKVLGVFYTWTVGSGASIVSGNGTNTVVINVSGVTATALSINVVGSNGTGASIPKTLVIKKASSCRVKPEEVVTKDFNVIAYPNPSSSEFTLDIQSSSKGAAGIKVYDMVGKLIEQRQIESSSIQIGANYPSGIYILKVNQGGNQKALRIIKKIR